MVARFDSSKYRHEKTQKEKCRSLKDNIVDFFCTALVVIITVVCIGGFIFTIGAVTGEGCAISKMRNDKCGNWCHSRQAYLQLKEYQECFNRCEKWSKAYFRAPFFGKEEK